MATAAPGAPARLEFYGDIISSEWDAWQAEDKCPQAIADFLATIGQDDTLEIHFNSGGGDVWAGVAIYNILARKNCHKVGYVDGLAASIASVILMACDEVVVALGAQVMIHKPWSWTAGNADDLRALADHLDGAEDSILDIYMAHAAEGKTREDFQAAMRAETWMAGTVCSSYFSICKETEEQGLAPAASVYYSRYHNAPESLPKEEPQQTTAQAEGNGLKNEPEGKDDKQPADEQNAQKAQESRRKRADALLGDLYQYGT